MKKFLILSIFALLFSSCIHKTIDCKVFSVDKIQETKGSSEDFHTDVYWLVSTDQGTYSIQPSGIWAYPQAVGMLKVDSIYSITVE